MTLALDSFDPAQRRQALLEKSAQACWPAPGTDVNLHTHTFYSYNAYGYSPTHFAVLARERGLAVAGIVDFDVLDGLEEFHDAGRQLGLKTVVNLESRVFVPEFSDRVINSLGEPGIAYHMGVGFTRVLQHPILSQMRATAAERNRELVDRVNRYLHPVTVDYDRDVLPLTPAGNATERHICAAYEIRTRAMYRREEMQHRFWCTKLGACPADSAALQALIRAKLMKKGGIGYVWPDAGSFPTMADMNRMVIDAGAIPTLAWLDGTSDGEQRIEELVQVAMRTGVAGINIVPDRNFTPGIRDRKLQNLYEIVALAEKHGLPVIIGTEMNAPGSKFVDAFDTTELKPLAPVFLKGAHIVYAHTQLERHCGAGYLSGWARQRFKTVAAKNEFYEQIGRALSPSATREDVLAEISKP